MIPAFLIWALVCLWGSFIALRGMSPLDWYCFPSMFTVLIVFFFGCWVIDRIADKRRR